MGKQSRARPGENVQATPAPPAAAAISSQYHLLDMGREQYGDCILCQFGDKTVLIDGGHPSDFKGQKDYDSIPAQLAAILGKPAPFDLTLLVVTHAHNDHIGCLPQMIEAGLLRPQFALVADPDLGFPAGARDALSDAAPQNEAALQRAIAGLAEEDHSFLPDPELDAFLDAVAKLGARYRAMLDRLAAAGTKVFKWGTSPIEELMPFYAALIDTGFNVIGPSPSHLKLCRDQIVAYPSRARDALRDLMVQSLTGRSDSIFSASALYRAIVGQTAAIDVLSDQKGQGSALNCQSIVLSFGHGADKVLLAADMQFHSPEVDGLDREMADLRRKVIEAGPYRFAKTTHHTSYNGLDAAFWQSIGKPPLLAHSGGSNDDKHPERGELKALQQLEDGIVFARTDRNGRIRVDLSQDNANAFQISRGELNDFTPNPSQPRRRDIPLQPATTGAPATAPQAIARTGPAAKIQPRPEPAPQAPSTMPPDDFIFVRLPHRPGKVVIDGHVIEVLPSDSHETGGASWRQVERPSNERQRDANPGDAKLAAGRDVSKLLFVTDAAKLAANIGETEAQRALRLISSGARCFQIDGITEPEVAVRNELSKGGYKGVVLIGGYDVVPSQRVDVLDPVLRASVPPKGITDDRDEFVVWSDDIWGDFEGADMPDLPVSRIPDGRYPQLVMRALQANRPASTSGRFGIRNHKRPFATNIFSLLPGQEELIVCAPTRFNDLPIGASQRPFVYFMLHGHDLDGSRFWGDNPGRGTIEAINTASLPTEGLGVVLAGCCWGALTVDQRAKDGGGRLSPKTPESSMALTSLMGGALAFVGCTGVHYSPGEGGDFFGGPMHRAFWQQLFRGRPPAEALFEARKQFLAEMPHGQTGALERGIERKIYKQFTCLGLGW